MKLTKGQGGFVKTLMKWGIVVTAMTLGVVLIIIRYYAVKAALIRQTTSNTYADDAIP